jgi:hypothetical protein
MRKILTAGLAALTLGGAVAATAVPADAAPWHGGGYHGGGWHGGGYRGGGAGWAVGAGLLGLAAGVAIADSGPHYGYGYGPGYYGGGYYGRPYGYATCVAPRRVWDPYYGGYVVQHVRYAC